MRTIRRLANAAPSLPLAKQFVSLLVAELQVRDLIGLEALPLTGAATVAVERAVEISLEGILVNGTIHNA